MRQSVDLAMGEDEFVRVCERERERERELGKRKAVIDASQQGTEGRFIYNTPKICKDPSSLSHHIVLYIST